MKATLEEMRAEAIRRMRYLMIHPNAILDFEECGKLNLSEENGMLFWLNKGQKSYVREWEKESGSIVYHVIHNNMGGDEMLNLLYVSDDPETWEWDWEDIRSRMVCARVVNLTAPNFTETGTIGVTPRNGGVVRDY